MIDEIFKPIPGFPDYEVSNMGAVRSLKRRAARILKTPPDNKGYQQVVLCHNGHSVHTRVHVLVMLAFVGPRPDGLEICHNDGIPGNNQLLNLRYDTHSANMQDCIAQGKIASLDLGQAKRIRDDRFNGMTLDALAGKYKTTVSIIRGVVQRGRYYAHAEGPTFGKFELNYRRARSIREDYAQGNITYKEVAIRYGVDYSTAYHIVNGLECIEAGGPIKGKDY